MWSINASVAYTLIGLTGLGVIFFVAIVIAGMSSYACPFQTPASTALRGPDIEAEGLANPPSTITTDRKPAWGCTDPRSQPWLDPKDLAAIRRTNANDVRCISWILRNITGTEALDTAIRLAGTIR